jgi:hypothetical protein
MFQGLGKHTVPAPSPSGSNRLRILHDDSDFPKGHNNPGRINEKLNQDLRCLSNVTSFLLHKIMLSVSDIVVDYCLRKPHYTVYLECHSVCPTEKTSFFSSRPNWDSPTPSHGQVCTSTPFGSGGGHIRLRERGVGGPNSDEGTYTVVL